MNPSQSRQTTSTPSSQPSPSNGPVAAAILSAGLGCFTLGVFAIVADASKPVASFFTFYLPTGPLSGVTTTAILLWLFAWFFLARFWRNKPVAIAKVNIAAVLLLALGILLTFPPFADLLLGK